MINKNNKYEIKRLGNVEYSFSVLIIPDNFPALFLFVFLLLECYKFFIQKLTLITWGIKTLVTYYIKE